MNIKFKCKICGGDLVTLTNSLNLICSDCNSVTVNVDGIFDFRNENACTDLD